MSWLSDISGSDAGSLSSRDWERMLHRGGGGSVSASSLAVTGTQNDLFRGGGSLSASSLAVTGAQLDLFAEPGVSASLQPSTTCVGLRNRTGPQATPSYSGLVKPLRGVPLTSQASGLKTPLSRRREIEALSTQLQEESLLLSTSHGPFKEGSQSLSVTREGIGVGARSNAASLALECQFLHESLEDERARKNSMVRDLEHRLRLEQHSKEEAYQAFIEAHQQLSSVRMMTLHQQSAGTGDGACVKSVAEASGSRRDQHPSEDGTVTWADLKKMETHLRAIQTDVAHAQSDVRAAHDDAARAGKAQQEEGALRAGERAELEETMRRRAEADAAKLIELQEEVRRLEAAQSSQLLVEEALRSQVSGLEDTVSRLGHERSSLEGKMSSLEEESSRHRHNCLSSLFMAAKRLLHVAHVLARRRTRSRLARLFASWLLHVSKAKQMRHTSAAFRRRTLRKMWKRWREGAGARAWSRRRDASVRGRRVKRWLGRAWKGWLLDAADCKLARQKSGMATGRLAWRRRRRAYCAWFEASAEERATLRIVGGFLLKACRRQAWRGVAAWRACAAQRGRLRRVDACVRAAARLSVLREVVERWRLRTRRHGRLNSWMILRLRRCQALVVEGWREWLLFRKHRSRAARVLKGRGTRQLLAGVMFDWRSQPRRRSLYHALLVRSCRRRQRCLLSRTWLSWLRQVQQHRVPILTDTPLAVPPVASPLITAVVSPLFKLTSPAGRKVRDSMARAALDQAFESWYAHVARQHLFAVLARLIRLTRGGDPPRIAVLSRFYGAWLEVLGAARASAAAARQQAGLVLRRAARLGRACLWGWRRSQRAAARHAAASRRLSFRRAIKLVSSAFIGWLSWKGVRQAGARALALAQHGGGRRRGAWRCAALAVLEWKCGTVKSKCDNLAGRLELLSTELAALQQASQQSEFSHAISQIAMRPLAEIEQALAEREAELEAKRHELRDKAAEAEALAAAHAPCTDEIASLERAVRDVKEKNLFLNRRLEQHATCQEDLATLRALLDERDGSLRALKDERDASSARQEAEVAALRQELSAMAQRDASSADIIAELEGRVADAAALQTASDALIVPLRLRLAEAAEDLALKLQEEEAAEARAAALEHAHAALEDRLQVPRP